MTGTDKPTENSSWSVHSPAEVLASAELLLQLDSTVFRSRTVARLLRHALELAVDQMWTALRPGEVLGRSTRARQIRLIAAVDQAAARDTYALWCVLSDAARPHIYELSAAHDELQSLQVRTGRAIAALQALHAVRTSPAIDSSCT